LKKRKTILLVLLVVTLIATASGIAVQLTWSRPLGQALVYPTYTETRLAPTSGVTKEASEPLVLSNPVVTSTLEAISGVTATPVPAPTATPMPLCGGPASMNILAIGSDQRGSGYMYGLGDSIHIMHIDFVTPQIMVIDFPRDLWVEIPGITDHYGITHGKLNQAYLFGNPGMGYYDGPGEGPGLMALTLDHNFGLRVDHYVAIDMQTFVKMIDAVGGVNVVVETPIDLSYGVVNPGPEHFLSVGTQHLDGERALLLATNRIPSTFQRMKYQKIILSALREKLLQPSMAPKIPGLVAQFITSVQTDFTPSQINSLICIFQVIPEGNIQADSFPSEMFTASVTYDEYRNVTTYIQEADFDEIRAKVMDFMNGIWPFP
jgi:LCP family protein required for cell wall assembly